METTQHMLFNCSNSSEVWNQVLSFINCQPQRDVVEELASDIKKAISKRSKDKVYVMLFIEYVVYGL